MLKKTCLIILLPLVLWAGEPVHLTFDSAVKIAMENSYRIKSLEMEIERTKLRLQARQAGLKSKVYMNLETPDLQQISEYKWNSSLRRDEIVRQNTRQWQSELSIKQPVMLFGYPTNGYISLNYNVYRYRQRDNGHHILDYYNRLYMKYEQPLFRPNELKNDLERARLAVRENELEYIDDRMEIIDDIGEDYYELFSLAFRQKIFNQQLELLQSILPLAESHIATDSSRLSEKVQLELEITNEKENLLESRSEFRREAADMKQRLRLNMDDSLYVTPDVHIPNITIKQQEAIQLGLQSNAYLKQLHIYKRFSELDVQEEKGENSFHVNLEFTYGLEKKDDRFQQMWQEYDNSNSVTVNAYVPLWDWGERKKMIQAEMVDVRRRKLEIEERRERIKKDIINELTNMREYQQRSLNMQQSRDTSQRFVELSMEQYADNDISLQDLLQIVRQHKETELKFLDTYMGYRYALLDLMNETFYDFENSQSLTDAELY